MDIRRVGNLHLVTFSHPSKDGFMQLVDAIKSVGATWSGKDKAWVLVKQTEVDVLKHALVQSSTPSQLLQVLQGTKAQYLDLPPMTGNRQPDGLALMKHQQDGVDFIDKRDGSLLAWEVGTGKTPATIACINAAGPKGFPALIICPAHLKLNWYREFKGDPEAGKKGWLVDQSRTVGIAHSNYFPDTDVVIINYDILSRHKAKIDSIQWAFAAVDEAHFIKGEKALRTRCIIGGSKGRGKDKQQWSPIRAKRRIALTGTPVVNDPSDLWPICHWLDPKRWPSLFWFQNKFCTVSRKQVYTRFGARSVREILPPSKAQLDDLNRRLTGSIMSRIRSRDVLDLPPLTRRIIEIELPEAQASIDAEIKSLDGMAGQLAQLKAAVELAKATGTEQEYTDAVHALAEYIQREQAHVAIIRQKTALAKVPYVLDHIQSILADPEAKVLLFAHHKAVIQALCNGAEKWLPGGIVNYYGDTSGDDKQLAEKRIQTDPTCRLLIGGITAAGTGLTLTGASYVVFAEEDWVPSNLRQCEGRAWRKGQTKCVLVDHLVAHGSIDSRMVKRMVAKQEISDRAIDQGLVLDEPVDWLEDHREDLQLVPPAPKVRAPKPEVPLTPIQQVVANADTLKVGLVDLIVATRLAALDSPGPKARAYIDLIVKRYLPEPIDDTVS